MLRKTYQLARQKGMYIQTLHTINYAASVQYLHPSVFPWRLISLYCGPQQ